MANKECEYESTEHGHCAVCQTVAFPPYPESCVKCGATEEQMRAANEAADLADIRAFLNSIGAPQGAMAFTIGPNGKPRRVDLGQNARLN